MKKDENYVGLNDEEVIRSREEYGANELEPKKKESLLIKIIHVFMEPMFLLLIVTASIYFILGEVSDGVIMLCFVLFICKTQF